MSNAEDRFLESLEKLMAKYRAMTKDERAEYRRELTEVILEANAKLEAMKSEKS